MAGVEGIIIMNTFEKIASLMAEQLGVDKASITAESEIIKDLGADSLDLVEMLLELEEAFGVEVSDEETESIVTVQDIVNLIDKM